MCFPGGSDGKESACDAGDPGSIPGWRRSPGRGHGNPFQYSCLENSTDRGAWWAYRLWDPKELDTTDQVSLTQPSSVTCSVGCRRLNGQVCFMNTSLSLLRQIQPGPFSPLHRRADLGCLEEDVPEQDGKREAEFSVLLVLQAPLVRCARRCVD